jgi:hypothetical protein
LAEKSFNEPVSSMATCLAFTTSGVHPFIWQENRVAQTLVILDEVATPPDAKQDLPNGLGCKPSLGLRKVPTAKPPFAKSEDKPVGQLLVPDVAEIAVGILDEVATPPDAKPDLPNGLGCKPSLGLRKVSTAKPPFAKSEDRPVGQLLVPDVAEIAVGLVTNFWQLVHFSISIKPVDRLGPLV